jgi:hypothetical protein
VGPPGINLVLLQDPRQVRNGDSSKHILVGRAVQPASPRQYGDCCFIGIYYNARVDGLLMCTRRPPSPGCRGRRSGDDHVPEAGPCIQVSADGRQRFAPEYCRCLRHTSMHRVHSMCSKTDAHTVTRQTPVRNTFTPHVTCCIMSAGRQPDPHNLSTVVYPSMIRPRQSSTASIMGRQTGRCTM